ncbi:MAG TPA: ThuA domain-containing protein [Saprospiraceae bacterium]|nr:ThuA domain-containing protein [Saprospiraceae bacterium]HNT21583.1 ThuA domain-containing protein [Saprospiraceae bacterium]
MKGLAQTCIYLLATILGIPSCTSPGASLRDGSGKLEILFLGHEKEHHNSARFLPLLASSLSKEGIFFTYTNNPDDLNEKTLGLYDALMIYANHEEITPAQETALLDYVNKGGGFVPIHCASFCFQNSPKYIDLVGGQFKNHGTDTFTAAIIQNEHPVMKNISAFSTWDETYVHDKLASDIEILMERVDGDHREPWTWIKTHGQGRVFYTAYGHDERTWGHPGFQQLVKEGLLWAVGDEAKLKWEKFKSEIPQLVYRDEPGIPNYEKRVPGPRFQEPLSPEQSAKLIQVPVGFDLKLFASEPDIINPIAMDWDERGRLWVIETVDYPNTVREDRTIGDDRIKICEDTDGDGKADKFTLFADNLNIPTSMVFIHGGVMVSQAPYFIFLKDTDGDDKADERKIIMEGWGTFDTHAGPSNLKYGLDNQIWGVVGYSGFDGVIAGENRKFSQGIYRFKPDLSSFEFMTGTSNNTWGLGITPNNDVFASTANNTHSVFLGIPAKTMKDVQGIRPLGSSKIDGHYAMRTITDHVRQVDVFGGFTAASGHNFYTARAYPREYWDHTALVCEPTGHLVHLAKIEKDGAGFIEKDGWNLFASADEWVSPVDAKTGPDGAVWVLDWYNFIVQHNPTPTPERGGFAGENGKGNAYENPLRDKSHGRIWRVVSRQAKPYKPMRLNPGDPDGLIAALNHDHMLWRLTAQRLLVERGKPDILPALYRLARENKDGNGYAAIHALWTLDGLVDLSKEDKAQSVVLESLGHPSPGVRKAAIQILSKAGWREETVIKNNLLNDPDPNTRMAAILSLAELQPSDSLGNVLYKMSLEESVIGDEWLSKAIYVAAVRHKNGFLQAFLADHPGYDPSQVKSRNRESLTYDDESWNKMILPTFIEDAGLDIDGLIWFRKTLDIPVSMAKKAKLSLGPVNDSDISYINGVRVGSTESRHLDKRLYEVAAGILKPGKNVIAIRVEDIGGRGGIYGKPEELFLAAGDQKRSLAGEWKYEVAQEQGPAKTLFSDKSIGETFCEAYLGSLPGTAPDLVENSGEAILIHLKTIKNEMKYDQKTFSVEAGKPVEIVFENPDFMQHNLLITQIGSLETVGKAADKLAADPQGAERQYVPDLPEVLFSTKLVNPQETVKLKFIAPEKPGDYPYVCTFPGHWLIMNGIMKVKAPSL